MGLFFGRISIRPYGGVEPHPRPLSLEERGDFVAGEFWVIAGDGDAETFSWGVFPYAPTVGVRELMGQLIHSFQHFRQLIVC